MSDRAPYAEVKNLVEGILDSLFKGMEVSHGWSKEEFFANYKQELISDIDEETYDLVFAAPETLQ